MTGQFDVFHTARWKWRKRGKTNKLEPILEPVTWYWKVGHITVNLPDHECLGPDCFCVKRRKACTK